MEEYASSGTYYFSTAKLMLDAFQEVIKQDLNVNGEYYVSLAYKILMKNQLPVSVYPLQHFMQWGTPEDVAEYNTWSHAFKQLIMEKNQQHSPQGTLIIPMAGLGQRFVDDGYDIPKPLIPVSGQAMVAQATHDLPPAENQIFILRSDMQGCAKISSELAQLYPNSILKPIDYITDGQACTTLIGLDVLEENKFKSDGFVTVGTCDNGMLYQENAFLNLVNNPEIDVIVWGIRGYQNAQRNPNMYGWIDEKDGHIKAISVKTPLQNPKLDPIVLGTFTFRNAENLRRSINGLIERDGRVNGEFYLDSCINVAIAMGLNCYLFEVDSYLCWGTPNDLRTFEYWQSCFHKWKSHPYRLELDRRVPKDKLGILHEKYAPLIPSIENWKKVNDAN